MKRSTFFIKCVVIKLKFDSFAGKSGSYGKERGGDACVLLQGLSIAKDHEL